MQYRASMKSVSHLDELLQVLGICAVQKLDSNVLHPRADGLIHRAELAAAEADGGAVV